MINVVNKRNYKRTKFGLYIGRPTILGNPFTIGMDGTRDEVIHKYKMKAIAAMEAEQPTKEQEEFKSLIEHIKRAYVYDKRIDLVCWCAPKACHGDVIKQLILGE